MGDARKTGISAVTDKIVYVRHASPIEREIIARQLSVSGPASALAAADLAVAVEDERLIGFAVLQPADREGMACLALVEEGKRRGIGGMVLKHLLKYAPVSKVLAGRKNTRYLKSAGFRRVTGPRSKPRNSSLCPVLGAGGVSAALYERVLSRA